MKYNTSKTKW